LHRRDPEVPEQPGRVCFRAMVRAPQQMADPVLGLEIEFVVYF
jgi:hypothetical protein